MVDLEKFKGVKSDMVEFIACIDDPSRNQPRMTKGKQSVNSHPVVGYIVKFLEDMTIPDSVYREKAKEYDDVELPIQKREVKAGEIVNLTLMDMIILISSEEFNGYITGGNFPIKLSSLNLKGYTTPRPTIRGADKSLGSIKVNSVSFAEGSAKNWVSKEEYARKFGGLLTNKQPHKNKEVVNKSNAHAEALRKLYANAMVDY